jgi:hypothetical protein
MIGAAPRSSFSTVGASAPSGRSGITVATRSRTSCAPTSRSTPSSNSTKTCATPSTLVERSERMPLRLLTASSIGSATCSSIVSGEAPG